MVSTSARGEVLQRDEWCRAVLPQRDDRVRSGLPAAHRRDDRRGAAAHEQRNQCRRRVVEQVRVVDPEQEPAAVGFTLQRADDAVQRAVASAPERGRGNEMRDGAERDRSRGMGRRDPLGAVALAGDAREDLVGEAGLPDAGGTGEHDTSVLLQRAGRKRELVVATDERPATRIDAARLGRSPPTVHRVPSGREAYAAAPEEARVTRP